MSDMVESAGNENYEPLNLPLDGLLRALQRFDGDKGIVGVCGPWSVHFRDYQKPRFDATIYKICFDDKPVVYCNWENKGDPNKEFIAVNRISGGKLSDRSYLSIVDCIKSVFPIHPYRLPLFEMGKIKTNDFVRCR